ncbi:hypothetical protein L1887_35525 [Cichorium endivia]|nr:hypothetical protein L1887_35525 [Cichorium endivia]
MKFTPIAIPALDEVPAVFCAQIPEGMLSKVSSDCIEVNTYRATLVIPYPVRDLAQEETHVTTKAQTRAKGKKKATGGPSGPKKGEKKRKASEQATPKKKQQKKSRKLAIRDESSESEKQTSEANPEAEEEEHQPPTLPHNIPPPHPPTTAQQTTTIHTTSSEVPPPPPPKTSSTTVPPISSSSNTFLNIPSSALDTSLPDFPFQDDFDFETSTFTKPLSKEETMAVFHMAPIAIKDADEESLDDADFILGKQYKILNRKLDALLQSNTGFDPMKKPEASVEDLIGEGKLKTAVEQIDEKHQLLKEQTDKRMEELLKKLELSNSEVTKELHDLRSSTESFNSPYQTGFAKHLSDAHKRVEELTAELSSSAVTTYARELRTTNQTIVTNMVNKLKNALQPMINVSLKMDRSQAERARPQLIAQGEHDVHHSQGGESEVPGSQAGETTTSEAIITTTTTTQQQQQTILGRPPFIPLIPSKTGPTFGTTTTTEAGGSSSQPLRKEIRIAPHMEQVNREREEEFRKILEINRIAIDNHTWTEDLIKSIGFNDFHVNNRLPLKSLETKNGKNQQLDLPYNPKTFAFLQFERSVTKDKLPELKTRKVAFHAKFIQAPNYVWSEKKIVKIIYIKRGEEYVLD